MPATHQPGAEDEIDELVTGREFGDADLYTSEYCTTFKIGESGFTYNRTRYYMPNRN